MTITRSESGCAAFAEFHFDPGMNPIIALLEFADILSSQILTIPTFGSKKI